MTYLFNNPTQFADELVEGFAAAHRNTIQRVNGGVIRRYKAKPGQAVVVIGGGSGHYPAFGGFVGQGLAHGAALGNVFAAPSAQQICQIAQAVDVGGGILFCYANYAGDVLNFEQAQAQLRAQGIDVRSVVVTDDIASAAVVEQHKRRGIAGTLPVFKAAAVAADVGKPLDEVVRIATEAKDRVRSLGVAFSGCTLPGANKPLFEVADGKIEVGMGIHGEPGLYRVDAPSADGLAEMLVEKLLAEIPLSIGSLSGTRVGVILNGLGAVKYEELFVIYRKIDQLLTQDGLIIVEPVVDELITSFDMAGVSLTLYWLNDELEQTWIAAADTPAFHRGNIAPAVQSEENIAVAVQPSHDKQPLKIGSADSQAAAKVVLAALEAARDAIELQQEVLGRLDAIAGDGDHGIGMQRGLTAAVEAARAALDAQAGAGTVLTAAGDAWSDRAGGTSGALWGVILRNLGNALRDEAKPDAATVAIGVAAALDAVSNLGKAQPGDKTLVDVLHPFAQALAAGAAQNLTVAAAWTMAAHIADEAAQATRNLMPRIGRARPHAEKSIGTPDPGAVSMALIIRAADKIVRKHCL
ncbi:dihydroxyacetone kinase family protein [Nitrosomonas oligotropha]|uniref:Homodimeric dihydroxyacetone kinase n=1 Tax=Nitrosomonas oligotropha TaxID=42354 RepID=A0A1H8TH93_9PROT|nr:dihydroxyacetone kinase family protein [Nitrosomonas oligotropha]SDX28591.1 homodimeric dihydroxyacetone kinase [Nitrosomonas oligotropha]SEO89893.1 homodimeric dihydroxyacetone kinase [Nitrosomonas oligotropha]